MINCYCLIQRSNDSFLLKNAHHENIKLRCSVCFAYFDSLSQLAEHKSTRPECVNDLRIESDDDDDDDDLIDKSSAPLNNTSSSPVKLMLVTISDEGLDGIDDEAEAEAAPNKNVLFSNQNIRQVHYYCN